MSTENGMLTYQSQYCLCTSCGGALASISQGSFAFRLSLGLESKQSALSTHYECLKAGGLKEMYAWLLLISSTFILQRKYFKF
jgi:hypothetical protein